MVAVSATTDRSPRRRQKAPERRKLPFTLAEHESRDCYFAVKLTQVDTTTFQGKGAHQLQFKLDLARPFDVAKRIRSATVSITVHKGERSRSSPKILGIDPEASLVKIADHEITSGQSIGVTAGTPPTVPGRVSASANMTWADKTTYEGNRLIHGFTPAPNKAQWKLYEEAKSKSGLPPSLQLLMIVNSKDDFWVTAELSVIRWGGWGGVGMVQTILAPREDERLKFFPVQGVSSNDSEAGVHKISDDIAACLKESEQKMKGLETVISEHFPKLTRAVIYKGCGAVLKLSPNRDSSEAKQLNIPFSPKVLRVGRQTDSQKTEPTETNGFFHKDTALSRQHAEIWADEETGTVWIRDPKSACGTFINGERLSHGRKYRLRPNDTLRFGTNVVDEKSKRQVVYRKVSMRVEYAGLPGLPGALGGRRLNLGLLRSHSTIPGEYVDTPAIRAERARRDVQDKFESWKAMATGEDQLKLLNLLQDMTNRRLEDLGIKPTEVVDDFEDEVMEEILRAGYHDRSRQRQDSVAMSDIGRPLRNYSGPSRSRRSTKPLFACETLNLTGEQALRNHRTVGGGWNETKL